MRSESCYNIEIVTNDLLQKLILFHPCPNTSITSLIHYLINMNVINDFLGAERNIMPEGGTTWTFIKYTKVMPPRKKPQQHEIISRAIESKLRAVNK
jgi:hypothetical protein